VRARARVYSAGPPSPQEGGGPASRKAGWAVLFLGDPGQSHLQEQMVPEIPPAYGDPQG